MGSSLENWEFFRRSYRHLFEPDHLWMDRALMHQRKDLTSLSTCFWSGGQGGDTRKSSGPGSGGEGENIEKFMKITLVDFAEEVFLLQPTTVKNLTFFRNNFVRVKMRPGAPEYDGEILWFLIANLEEEEGFDEENNMFILNTMSIIGIAVLIGGWVCLTRISKCFNWDSFVRGSFGRDTKENAGMGSDIKTEYDADVRK